MRCDSTDKVLWRYEAFYNAIDLKERGKKWSQ